MKYPAWFRLWIERIREKRDAREFTQTGILRKAEANAAAGVLTVDGFLGTDGRSLPRIIRDDTLGFTELGLDWNRVADRLDELLVLGSEGLGEPITVGGYLVRVAETRGNLPCPWEDGLLRKRSVTVQRLDNGSPAGPELLYSDLSVHLLREHHFLQGKGSPFRLDPKVIFEVLGPV